MDAFTELPRLCPVSSSSTSPPGASGASSGGRASFDAVVLDPFDDGLSWQDLITAVKPCKPRYWIINNVQWSDVSDVVMNLLANGNSLALHDFSPTLVANKFHLEEFVVLIS